MSEILYFLMNYGFNLLIAFIIVCLIYYPSTHNKPYVFTFMAFNTVIYFVLYFMASIEIGIGVGFGLFAIFTILRYRTETMPIREMTYLFVISAVPVMNAAGVTGSVGLQLVAANITVVLMLLILEKGWGFHYECSRQVIYEKIELIHSERHDELIADLESRTGLKINRVVVGKLDYLRDIATLQLYFNDTSQSGWLYHLQNDD